MFWKSIIVEPLWEYVKNEAHHDQNPNQCCNALPSEKHMISPKYFVVIKITY